VGGMTDASSGLLVGCAGTTGNGISSVSDVRWRFLAARPAVVQKLLVNLYAHTEFGNNYVVEDDVKA
jgi:3D (Asp-Asp-Asp) domain-containing protein